MRTGPVVKVTGAVAAVLLAAVSLAACGSSPSTSTTSTTTTLLHSQPIAAIFPYYADGVRFVTPVAAAREYALRMVHMTSPSIGSYHRQSSISGAVGVAASPGGSVTTVSVSQVTGDGTWWVTGSSSPDVVITQPTVGTRVASPLTLTGNSLAFEAVVNVSVYADGSMTPIGTSTVMGGSTSLAPFSGSVSFTLPASSFGTLFMYVKSAKDNGNVAATAIRVRF
jgi:hypothetical protein